MDPVVVELKKERAPRDVIAQVLEYTTWVADLDYNHIARLAAEYLKKPLTDAYWEAFKDDHTSEEGIEELTPPDDAALAERFYRSHPRVFIVAGEIPDRTRAVAQFLRGHHLEVICLEVKRSLGEDV
jgi:hypothetical protein